MKTNFDNIRKNLIDRTNRVMRQAWKLHKALDDFGHGGAVSDEFDQLERLLDSLRDPVVAIGCLESDGTPDDAFKALEFDLLAAREEDQE